MERTVAFVDLAGFTAMTDTHGDEDAFPIVRAGLHHGPVVARGSDLFGATVNLASRVAAQAGGGQVLGTAVVAAAAGVDARSLGAFTLRNIPDPVELFELVPCPTPHDREIDPVCRMAVSRSAAAGRLAHGGHDHWFCSLACAGAFAADPDRYPNATAANDERERP